MQEIPRIAQFEPAGMPEYIDNLMKIGMVTVIISAILIIVAFLIYITCICSCVNAVREQIASGQTNAGYVCTVQTGRPNLFEVQSIRASALSKTVYQAA
jgi:hypothetical protein